MTWQEFMYGAIGFSVIGVAVALVITLSKLWRTLDNVEEVSTEVRRSEILSRVAGTVGTAAAIMKIFRRR